jgi:hypothetical protein
MASTFKTFLNNDVVSTRTLLHEAIPITGSIISGTYVVAGVEKNIKNYAHGMFQSIYDYPVLSSSANHIFDITEGLSPKSSLSSSLNQQNSKKINLYNQMAQVLVGSDVTGSVLEFDQDGNILGTTNDKLREVFFINFSRLLVKDEIKKDSFRLVVGTGSFAQPFAGTLKTVADYGAQNEYRVNSPSGEYGILYTSSVTPGFNGNLGVGLIYYQAGIAVITASLFAGATMTGSTGNVANLFQTSSIEVGANSLRRRIQNLEFNNTTELNSTIYFCRLNHNEFNYSSNPTYLSSSKIVVKNNSIDNPVSYVTSVGLYSADNELLAVAKLSEPLKKDPTNEMILRVRLDY